MTFSILTPDTAAATWERARRRVLISGSPNSGKTSSLATFPRPIAVMFFPGEKGQTSLEVGADVKAWVPEPSDPEKPQNWAAMVQSVERATNEILAGKHGQFQTFAGDGLHKLYTLYLAEATAGASMRGEEFDAKMYGSASKKFFTYLDRVLRSSMPYVVLTVWDGREKDDPSNKSKDAPSHIFPELPGKAAKDIMGEVSVAVYATKVGPSFKWQTRPQGSVWGCGVKLPPALAEKIPSFVDQDWSKFEPLLAQKG
jgi:hypothetical protein